MFHRLSAKHVQDTEAVGGFEWTVDGDLFDPLVSITSADPSGEPQINWNNIQPHESKTVSFRPLAVILHQSKLLPLKVAPLTFEFELAETPAEEVAFGPPDLGIAQTFSDTKGSKDWSLFDVHMKCDLLTLDTRLDTKYTQHLLQGKAL